MGEYLKSRRSSAGVEVPSHQAGLDCIGASGPSRANQRQPVGPSLVRAGQALTQLTNDSAGSLPTLNSFPR